MKNILLIDDDPALRIGLRESLEKENFAVFEAENGEDGYEMSKSQKYDLILLDLILPLKDGIEVCRDLRNEGIKTPIIMLTSKREEVDKIIGLEIGADDYITKPFSLRELIARIKAVLRRSTYEIGELNEFSFGNIKLDFDKQEAYKNDIPLKLTATEFKVLHYFIQHEREVISRDKFLDDVWGYDSYPTTRTVDNYILSLRKKIEDDPSNPRHLLTIFTVGYKFVK